MRVAWIARRALSTAPAAAPSLTLYQYAVCPFCNKAQAFLEHYAIPHRRVEVNPLSKKEIAFSKDYRMVPLAVVHSPAGDRQVNGSDAIVDAVALAIGLPAPTIDEQRWRDFVNNRLVKLLPPNIYRTPSEALQAFDYISSASNFSAWEKFTAKYAGAVAMFFIGALPVRPWRMRARADVWGRDLHSPKVPRQVWNQRRSRGAVRGDGQVGQRGRAGFSAFPRWPVARSSRLGRVRRGALARGQLCDLERRLREGRPRVLGVVRRIASRRFA